MIKAAAVLSQVTSIKCRMWDSVYDTLQAISQQELNSTVSDKSLEYEIIEIEPSERVADVNTKHTVQHIHGNRCLLYGKWISKL